MFYKFYAVASLDDINKSLLIPGNEFILPTGEVYLYSGAGDELGGFGSFLKKYILPVAAVGVGFIPGIGGIASTTIQKIAGAGVGAASGILSASGGSGGSGQAKGLAAIQSAGQQVISQFDALNQKIQSDSGFPKPDAYAAADKLVSVLSDSTYFYQAKKGNDAAALANFKTQAAQLAAKSKSLADAAELQRAGQSAQLANGQTAAAANGQTAAANGQTVESSLISGVSNQTLLLIIAGLGAAYILSQG